MEQLKGRTAVVTGAASGIGLAITEAFVGAGMSVVMADRTEDMLHEQAARLSAEGAQVLAVPTDVSDSDAVERLAQATVDHFGQLHVAVNNAGIADTGQSWELSLERWRRVLDVNLWGVVHGIRAFVPRILASGEEGHIVNTGSLASVLGLRMLSSYTVAKHGVLGLSDVLRADLDALEAPIGVSVIMPGNIRTGLNPVGTVTAEQVAANVVDGIRRRRAYVFTDADATAEVEARLQAILDARADVLF